MNTNHNILIGGAKIDKLIWGEVEDIKYNIKDNLYFIAGSKKSKNLISFKLKVKSRAEGKNKNTIFEVYDKKDKEMVVPAGFNLDFKGSILILKTFRR